MIKIFLLLTSIFLFPGNDNNPGQGFNDLNAKIRDQIISKKDAINGFRKYIGLSEKFYANKKATYYGKDKWIFPIKGYSKSNIGGNKGNGYVVGGYNYFDGNKHTGHPAHDIFIYDKNQDCKDDRTKKLVEVLSMSGGIVIGLEKNWDGKSGLRGGKYIWIYDPASKLIFYYAHNSSVKVNSGDIVKAGDVIAYVGRSGLNAFKKRSPTHLHFMCLKLDKSGLPIPYNIYGELMSAKIK